MPRQIVHTPLVPPVPNGLSAIPSVLFSSIWATGTEASPPELVNGVSGRIRGTRSTTHEALDKPPVVGIPPKLKENETQTALHTSQSQNIECIQDIDLIDLDPTVDAASTLVALSDSSDEDLIEFEPKVAKAFKTRGRGKFTMELVHWFTDEEKLEAEEKHFDGKNGEVKEFENDLKMKSAEKKGYDRNGFREKERAQMESDRIKPKPAKLEMVKLEKEKNVKQDSAENIDHRSVKMEVVRFKEGVSVATMLLLRNKVPKALHASLKSRLHVLGLERIGMEWYSPVERIVPPQPKKGRPVD